MERGIAPETLVAFGVRFEGAAHEPEAVLPYPNGEKRRTGILGGKRRFFFTEGRKPALYLPPTMPGDTSSVMFLVEGETDTMRLWQELHRQADTNGVPRVRGLSGIHTWRPEMAEEFRDAEKVFVILDNDPDYNVASQVDTAWRAIRQDLGAKAKRLRLPEGVKDLCEFFREGYDLDSLRALAGRTGAASRYKPLDLTREPPPPKWLADGLVAMGDTTLLSGPPGIGKSWITMGLTTAVAGGEECFLGHIVFQGGRVLYVDQENPDDVIFQRLRKLGLSREGMGNLRYLWNQDIRLDRNPEAFLEEALDYMPTLIVLDSLTRLHSQDENSAGAMAALFNEGIQPLARETGAAVVLIHHDNKAGGVRGSIDIEASVDAVLHVRSAGETPGSFVLRQGKSRRRLGGDEIIVRIKDNEDGTTFLDAQAKLDPPF